MEYKKKLIILLSITGVLALIYTVSLILDPEIAGSRSASHVWLDSRFAGRTARIVINTAGESSEFIRKNNQWFVLSNGREYPARQLRIEDFIGIFTIRAAWPVRSSSASSHDRFGLDSDSASRVTLYGETSTLLDLLIGGEDITGREVYLRRHGQNEVRSGDNFISSYVRSPVSSWYNLRLIPESEDGRVAVDSVQRLSVYSRESAQLFSRVNREWTLSGFDTASLNQSSIDSYVRAVLNTEGDDFIDYITVNDPMFDYNRIVLELGTGIIRTFRLSDADESGRRYAAVDGFDYVYSLAPWAAQRLFRDFSDFERQ